jgi:hypothetical protein
MKMHDIDGSDAASAESAGTALRNKGGKSEVSDTIRRVHIDRQ